MVSFFGSTITIGSAVTAIKVMPAMTSIVASHVMKRTTRLRNRDHSTQPGRKTRFATSATRL